MQPPDPAPAPRPDAAEPRQRWRIVFRRGPGAPALAQREQLAAWEVGMAACGLPLLGLELPLRRPRLVFGAPLPVGMPAERELLDVFLAERRLAAEVREALALSLPVGHDLVDIYDVWLGEPALPGRVIAADYLVTLGAEPFTEADGHRRLQAAAERFLAADSLARVRDKSGRSVAYDLRPLVADIEVVEIGPGVARTVVVLRIRTRFDPERGVGRPEEVVAALSEMIGVPMAVASVVRERLIVAGDLG